MTPADRRDCMTPNEREQELVQAVEMLLASASPNKVEHPSMTAAWTHAKALLLVLKAEALDALRAAPRETEPEDVKQCESCQGAGQVVLGHHVVTRDMATDAGEPAMEGMDMGPEWGRCPECGGGGLIAADLPSAAEAAPAKPRMVCPTCHAIIFGIYCPECCVRLVKAEAAPATAKLLDDQERFIQRIIELEDLLTSARAIAKRKGEGTSWERFDNRLGQVGVGSITAKTFRVLPHEVAEAAPPQERWTKQEVNDVADYFDGIGDAVRPDTSKSTAAMLRAYAASLPARDRKEVK